MNSRHAWLFLIGFGFLSRPASAEMIRYKPEPKDPARLVKVGPDLPAPPIEIRGNFSIPSEVLRKVMNLSNQASVDEAGMLRCIEAATEFYREQGFDFVRIEFQKKGDLWTVLVDEGVLRGLYVIGLGWTDTYMLRQGILPYDTFNRKHLEEGLRFYLDEHPEYRASYEIVERPEKTGEFEGNPLRSYFTANESLAKLRSVSRRELYIYFDRSGDSKGARFGLGYSSSNGLEFNGEYGHDSLLLKDDRFRLDGMVGLDKRGTIDPDEDGNMYYSNLEANVRWYTPPLSGAWFRLFLDGHIRNETEQRPTLEIDRYRSLDTHVLASGSFEWHAYRQAFVSLGWGLRDAYSIDQISGSTMPVGDDSVSGPLFNTGVRLLFGEARRNSKLNDFLTADLTYQWRGSPGSFYQVRGDYQKVFFTNPVVYLLRSQAVWMGGDGVEFYDERYLKKLGMESSFDRYYWVRRGINVKAEVRFNLYSDDVQLGLFNDIALFGNVDPLTGEQSFAAADDIGPSLYVMLFDAYQISVKYSTGFSTVDGAETSYDFNLGFDKVF